MKTIWSAYVRPRRRAEYRLPRCVYPNLIEAVAHVALLFEPRDLWVGVYWTRDDDRIVRVHVCLVPMLPIRISWWRRENRRGLRRLALSPIAWLAVAWLRFGRGYREGESVTTRADLAVLRIHDWACGHSTGSLWAHVRSAWHYRGLPTSRNP